ncbi:MAG: hypothetical protein DRH26_18890, partial [Deltaproteobacteria bacterium]
GKAFVSTGSGSLYLDFHLSSFGSLPLAFILASSFSSHFFRRSTRIRSSRTEADSTSGFILRQSAVRSPRKADTSIDCLSLSRRVLAVSRAFFAFLLLAWRASILLVMRFN